MISLFSRTWRVLFLFPFVWLVGGRRVWANHAGAIHISEQTYTLFLYIFFSIALLLMGVLFNIWRLSRKINSQKRRDEDCQETLYRRKFFVLAAMMLVIGLLSIGMFYLFLWYDIAS